jgi:hypothetical protein
VKARGLVGREVQRDEGNHEKKNHGGKQSRQRREQDRTRRPPIIESVGIARGRRFGNIVRIFVMGRFEQGCADRARRDGRQKFASEKPAVVANNARGGGAEFRLDQQDCLADGKGRAGFDQQAGSRQVADDDGGFGRRRARGDIETEGAAFRPPAVGRFDRVRDMGQQGSHQSLPWRTVIARKPLILHFHRQFRARRSSVIGLRAAVSNQLNAT